jgi:Histidine kinase-like ATPase domain
MTTAAVRTTRVLPYRIGDAMDLNFSIVPRRGNEPPRAQDAHQVGVMRRITAARLRHWGLEALVDGVTLIVSELVTNAIMHSRGIRVSFKMQVQDGLLYIAVCNEVPGDFTLHKASDDAEHGRGLLLVAGMAAAHGGTWGVSEDRTTVWCLLPAGVGR